MDLADSKKSRANKLSLLKLVQEDQINRLQKKCDLHLELLDDLRRLVDVWLDVLSETENIAKMRLAAADTYLQNVSDPCKKIRSERTYASKMVFEQLAEIQKEIIMSVIDTNRSQKVFRVEERITNDARVKASNADNKVKNKQVGRFTSMSKLQQQSAKLSAALDACELKSTAACNEYLLNLAATNAQLSRYYEVDLVDLAATLDGDFYGRYARLLQLMSETEVGCSDAVCRSFKHVADNTTKIKRSYDHDLFLRENYVFCEVLQVPTCSPSQSPLDDQDNDKTVRSLRVSKDHEAEVELNKHARAAANKIAKESRAVRVNTKKLAELDAKFNVKSSTSLSGSAEAVTAQTRREELRVAIRKSETELAKARGRIGALRMAGVNVDEWLESAVANDDEDDECSSPVGGKLLASANGILPSFATETAVDSDTTSDEDRITGGSPIRPTGSGSILAEQRTYIKYPEDIDYVSEGRTPSSMSDTVRIQSSSQLPMYPIWCVALYDYEAVNDDELSIKEKENLELTGDGDGDGWLKARNSSGEEGFIPENYIRIWNPAEDGDDIDVNEMNVDNFQPALVSSVKRPAKKSTSSSEEAVFSNIGLAPGEEMWVRALYDFEPTGEEDLGFDEGTLIRVTSLRLRDDGVDDGWWEGEIDGVRGIFPSLVVEKIKTEDEEIISGLPYSDEPSRSNQLPTPDRSPSSEFKLSASSLRPATSPTTTPPRPITLTVPLPPPVSLSLKQYVISEGAESVV